MHIFELKLSTSEKSRSFKAAWFDNEAFLWDDVRLHKSIPLLSEWNKPQLRLHKPDLGATDVIFNPNAIAVSGKIRDELSKFPEIEFLPIELRGHEEFFLFHVTASCELPAGSVAKISGAPGNNIVEIDAFPAEFSPSMAFFRVRQPPSSAAGRLGNCVRAIYMNEAGANALNAIADTYIYSVPRS